MKNTSKKKEIQSKLQHQISEYAKSLTKVDSKKIKKSIKKASRLIAKAIIKNSDESEVSISLKENNSGKKKVSVKAKRKIKTVRKRKTFATAGKKVLPVKKAGVKGNGIQNHQPESKAGKTEPAR